MSTNIKNFLIKTWYSYSRKIIVPKENEKWYIKYQKFDYHKAKLIYQK